MKRKAQQRISMAMTERGWPPRGLWGLPPAHARDTLVTPYFHCSGISSRGYGRYVIEGVIGILHLAFEKLWLRDPHREPKAPGFAAQLYLGNFKDINRKCYISLECSDEEIEVFCADVVTVLEQMPGDEPALIGAFERGDLCGFPIEAFSGYSHRLKFQAFSSFVRQRSWRPDL